MLYLRMGLHYDFKGDLIMEQLTSRERVRISLNHQEPDRLPIDFGAMRSTGINAIAYNRLKKYLGMKIPKQRSTIYISNWQNRKRQ